MQERKVRKCVTHFRTTYAHVPGVDAKFVELATRLRGSTWEEPIRKGAKKFVTHFGTTCDHVTFRPRRTWREWRVWLMLMQHFYAKREQEPPSFINLCRNLFHAPKCFPNCKQVEIKLSPILNPHFPAAPNLVWDQNLFSVVQSSHVTLNMSGHRLRNGFNLMHAWLSPARVGSERCRRDLCSLTCNGMLRMLLSSHPEYLKRLGKGQIHPWGEHLKCWKKAPDSKHWIWVQRSQPLEVLT